MIEARIPEIQPSILLRHAAAMLTPDSAPPAELPTPALYDPGYRGAAMRALAWSLSGRLWMMRRALRELPHEVLLDLVVAAEVLKGHAAELAAGEDTQVMLPVGVDGYPIGGGTR